MIFQSKSLIFVAKPKRINEWLTRTGKESEEIPGNRNFVCHKKNLREF
jgi:hypothetical protein